ncbi:sulfatase [Aquisphaera giovannonii]|nr:sulfatase [Aquisphaera giovannonii]
MILPSMALGLCGGFLEVGLIVLRKYSWNESSSFEAGSDFAWTVPLVHMGTLSLVGLAIAIAGRILPGRISPRAASWLVVTLALWLALLRLPLYGAATFLLAAGLARPSGLWLARMVFRSPRRTVLALSVLMGLLVSLAAITSVRWAFRERTTRAALPLAPSSARNVLLIVWDTVRASSLSAYGYPRETTPNLQRWARRGVRFDRAAVTAPWTFPSHASFLTGEWPFRINSQWEHHLDPSVPTLSAALASRGYETAGFAANTSFCSYENGLNRGFLHYEDYPLTPTSALGRTAAGNWLLRQVAYRDDYFEQKWIERQSRDGARLNEAFLRWLAGRRVDRPFFAFLNYYDAHDPYIPPRAFAGRFGTRPQGPADEEFLMQFARPTRNFGLREAVLARDCYDDCIASLDDQLGRLLGELDRLGTLANTTVIVTSDHGEAFGEHGRFGHGGSVYMEEVWVPLVIVSPDAPAGRTIAEPVSLRDLPATAVDLAGLREELRFPGHSLATCWGGERSVPGGPVSYAFSELVYDPKAVELDDARKSRRLKFSMMAGGHHYVRDGLGGEQLFEVGRDPQETFDRAAEADSQPSLAACRGLLLKQLDAERGAGIIEDAYLRRFRDSLRSAAMPGRPGP